MRLTRSCGVLLHPTCLPGRYGIGDLGPEAFAYVDWLASAGAGWWQVLPINPTSQGDSPYSATSTFAGNPLLISPDRLLEDGLLQEEDLSRTPDFVEHTVDFERVRPFKEGLLRRAWERFRSAPPPRLAAELAGFRASEAGWLDDYCTFAALAAAAGSNAWRHWPAPLAAREEGILSAWRERHVGDVDFHAFCQFLFFRQWQALHAHAHGRGVRLFGDLPIFVALDSADVWAHRQLFRLDDAGAPTFVAGVPPDYFSATGQRWGNPVYDWGRHAHDGYRWWAARLQHALRTVDLLRLDHFRGFVASWLIPASEPTAVKGRWVRGPGERFFAAMREELGPLALVAEDLGFITPDVIALKERLGLPGMAVLQFAFTPGRNSTFLPHNHVRNLVVYTGTHDNDTTVGWWLGATDDGVRNFLRRYLATEAREIHWELVRAALASVAQLAVVPHQDLAGLGGDCRMNRPGVAEGNWRFRLTRWMLDDRIRDRFAGLVRLYAR